MTPEAAARERAVGTSLGVSAYLLWGVMPLYFLSVNPTGPFELVSLRVIFALVVCVLIIALTRSWQALWAIVREPRLLALTALAGALIYVNWQVFTIATLTGHVIETSLGYFINPIVTVLLGVLVLHERLRRLQWLAVGLAAVAVGVLVVGYGAFPWISLSLAFSFGIYGLVKKQIGPRVDAVSGLTLESFWLLPVALVQLIVVANFGALTFGSQGPWHAVLLVLAGPVTAVPLLLFAASSRRIPLSLMGMLQFITPIMQFITGAWLLGEPMPPERWAGFAIVWLALAVLTADSLRAARRARRGGRAASVEVGA